LGRSGPGNVAVWLNKFDATAREADARASAQGDIKPIGVGAVVGQHDRRLDPTKRQFHDQLFNKSWRQLAVVRRIEPNIAMPLLRQPIRFRGVKFLGSDPLLCRCTSCWIEVNDAEHLTSGLDVLPGRVALKFPRPLRASDHSHVLLFANAHRAQPRIIERCSELLFINLCALAVLAA
jgi:hypothetical protein